MVRGDVRGYRARLQAALVAVALDFRDECGSAGPRGIVSVISDPFDSYVFTPFCLLGLCFIVNVEILLCIRLVASQLSFRGLTRKGATLGHSLLMHALPIEIAPSAPALPLIICKK
jgi:hypothetical protein